MKPEDRSPRYSNPHYLIQGYAGTGKTTKALSLAKTHRKIHIIRNTVGVRDLGFLKGSILQKVSPFFDLYKPILEELDIPNNRVVYDVTTHLRGVTFTDEFVIVDEAQNLTYKELFTVLTRVGKGSTLCVVGDSEQCDLPEGPVGFRKFSTVFRKLAKEIYLEKQYRSDLISKYMDEYRKIYGKKEYEPKNRHKNVNGTGKTVREDLYIR